MLKAISIEVNATRLTGFERLMQSLKVWILILNKIVLVATNGAPLMVGQTRGLIAQTSKLYPFPSQNLIRTFAAMTKFMQLINVPKAKRVI